MGERFLMDDLPWSVDRDAALKRLRVMEDDLEDFDEIYEKTLALIKPVYYAGVESVEQNDGSGVVIGGIRFDSRVVSVNLKNAKTVYPYVGTAGRAAYEYALGIDDEIMRYWADQLCEMAFKSAAGSFILRMREKVGSEKLSALAPGSVIDWPISQQKPLFELLGDVYAHTGIFLEKSFLMRPVKSGSGLLYVSEKHFESCSLCPKENCPNRRAPFDKDKFEREYLA